MMTNSQVSGRQIDARPEPAAKVRLHGWFLGLAVAWLIVSVASTIVGVASDWPAQFGGPGSPDRIATEWMSSGTVLSPPLFLMVALAVAIAVFGVLRGRGWRIAAVILSAIVGVIATVGSFGEVVAPATPDVPRLAQFGGIIGVVLSLAVAVAAVLVAIHLIARRP